MTTNRCQIMYDNKGRKRPMQMAKEDDNNDGNRDAVSKEQEKG